MPGSTVTAVDLELPPPAGVPGVQPGLDRRSVTLIVLAGLLALASLASLSFGAMHVGLHEALSVLLRQLGFAVAASDNPVHEAVILAVRLPRLLIGASVGAGLAIAGAALQAVFRNPLADPALIGVSSGAALAAAAFTVLGGHLPISSPALLATTLPLVAFGGAWAAVELVQRLGRNQGVTSVARLLLAGIAINALAQALTGMLLFIASDAQLRSLLFWNLGSLGAAGWLQTAAAVPLMVIAVAALCRGGQALNLMLLGDDAARHLGVDVERVKRRVVLWATLAVGSAVAVVGIIGFVGLAVPHLLRLAFGADHRLLLPASALLGASLLLAADVGARTLAAPAEVPIGIVTALLGGPFFLWLIVRDDSMRTPT